MTEKYINEGQAPYEPCAEVQDTIIGRAKARSANRRYYKLKGIKIRCKVPQQTLEGKELTTAEMRKPKIK